LISERFVLLWLLNVEVTTAIVEHEVLQLRQGCDARNPTVSNLAAGAVKVPQLRERDAMLAAPTSVTSEHATAIAALTALTRYTQPLHRQHRRTHSGQGVAAVLTTQCSPTRCREAPTRADRGTPELSGMRSVPRQLLCTHIAQGALASTVTQCLRAQHL
jgi:hypothetical protein